MIVIDVCSGEGGFSQAFVDRGHEVIRIDNNNKFKDVPNTRIVDIKNIGDQNLPKPDILLMSPPCNNFSIASCHHHWTRDGIPKHQGTVDAIRTVFWCLDAVDILKPGYWVLENPRGKLRKVLGNPSVTTHFASWGSLHYKPTDLWGKLPSMEFLKPFKWEKAPRGSTKTGSESICGEPSKRARIPYKLSEAICLAVENSIDHTDIPCLKGGKKHGIQ